MVGWEDVGAASALSLMVGWEADGASFCGAGAAAGAWDAVSLIVRLERRLVSVFPSLGTDGEAVGAAAGSAGAEDAAGMGATPVSALTMRIVSAGTEDSLLAVSLIVRLESRLVSVADPCPADGCPIPDIVEGRSRIVCFAPGIGFAEKCVGAAC